MAPRAGCTAIINVTVQPPLPPAPAPVAKSLAERMETELADAYFDFDKTDIRDDAQVVLTADASALRSILADFPDGSVDRRALRLERGSAQYNLALGDRRDRRQRVLGGARGEYQPGAEDLRGQPEATVRGSD